MANEQSWLPSYCTLVVTVCKCFNFASLTESNSDGDLTFASRRVCRARRPMGGIYCYVSRAASISRKRGTCGASFWPHMQPSSAPSSANQPFGDIQLGSMKRVHIATTDLELIYALQHASSTDGGESHAGLGMAAKIALMKPTVGSLIAF